MQLERHPPKFPSSQTSPFLTIPSPQTGLQVVVENGADGVLAVVVQVNPGDSS